MPAALDDLEPPKSQDVVSDLQAPSTALDDLESPKEMTFFSKVGLAGEHAIRHIGTGLEAMMGQAINQSDEDKVAEAEQFVHRSLSDEERAQVIKYGATTLLPRLPAQPQGGAANTAANILGSAAIIAPLAAVSPALSAGAAASQGAGAEQERGIAEGKTPEQIAQAEQIGAASGAIQQMLPMKIGGQIVSPFLRIGVKAGIGAVAGAGISTLTDVAQGRPVSIDDVIINAGVTALSGAVHGLATPGKIKYLETYAKSQGFEGGSTNDLKAWYENKAAEMAKPVTEAGPEVAPIQDANLRITESTEPVPQPEAPAPAAEPSPAPVATPAVIPESVPEVKAETPVVPASAKLPASKTFQYLGADPNAIPSGPNWNVRDLEHARGQFTTDDPLVVLDAVDKMTPEEAAAHWAPEDNVPTITGEATQFGEAIAGNEEAAAKLKELHDGVEAKTAALQIEFDKNPGDEQFNKLVKQGQELGLKGQFYTEALRAAAPEKTSAPVPVGDTQTVSSVPSEAGPVLLPSYAIKGAALIQAGQVDPEAWMKTMAADTGLNPQQLFAVHRMASSLIGEGGRLDTQKIIDLNTGVSEPTAVELAKPISGNNAPALRVKARALISQINGMMSTQDALRQYYLGQQQAGSAGAVAQAGAMREAGWQPPAPPETAKQAIARTTGLGRPSDVRQMRAYYQGQQAAAAGAAAGTRQLLLDQDKLGRQAATKIRTDLLALVKELPTKDQGPFTSAITDAMRRPVIGNSPEGMFRRSTAVAFRILNRIDEVEKQGVIDEIQKTVDRALKSGGVDVEYKKQIEQALSKVSLEAPSGKTIGRLESTKEYIDRVGEDHGVPSDIVQQLDMLAKTPAVDLPTSVLRALLDRVKLLEKLGRTMVRGRQALYDGEKEALVKDMASGNALALNDRLKTSAPGIRLNLPARIEMQIGNKIASAMNWGASVGRSLMVRDVVLDTLDGNAYYDGPLCRIVGGRIDLDYNSEMNMRRALFKPFEDLLDRFKYDNVELERISIYAIAKEENGIERLQDSGVSPALIDHVNRTITPKEKLFYDTARKVLDSVFPAIKKMMRDLYNIDVKEVKDYWMFQQDMNKIVLNPEALKTVASKGGETGLDELAAWNNGLSADFVPRRTTKTEQGMTIERIPEASGGVKLNALDSLDRHIRRVAHLLSTQRDTKMLGEIVRDPAFAERYGKLGQDYVLNLLDTVARDAAPAGATRSRLLDVMIRNTSVGVIGLRLISQLKHLPNFAFSLANVRPDFLARGMAEAFTPQGRAFIARNFAEISQRFGGEPAIAELANGNIWRRAQAGSFVIERALDTVNARATVLGRYLQELNDAGKDWRNYPNIPIDTEAQRKALVISRMSVTSPLRKDLPQAVSRGTLTGKNMSYTHALFQFQNTMLRQSSFLKHDIGDLGVKEGNIKQLTIMALAFVAMLAGESLIVEVNRKITGSKASAKRKADLPMEMGTELSRRIPFIGNIVGMSKYGETGVPVVDTSIQALKSSYQAAMDKGEFGRNATPSGRRATRAKAFGAAGSLLGVPGAATGAQIYQNQPSWYKDLIRMTDMR